MQYSVAMATCDAGARFTTICEWNARVFCSLVCVDLDSSDDDHNDDDDGDEEFAACKCRLVRFTRFSMQYVMQKNI